VLDETDPLKNQKGLCGLMKLALLLNYASAAPNSKKPLFQQLYAGYNLYNVMRQRDALLTILSSTA
jgi:hypothetical protein